MLQVSVADSAKVLLGTAAVCWLIAEFAGSTDLAAAQRQQWLNELGMSSFAHNDWTAALRINDPCWKAEHCKLFNVVACRINRITP